MIEINRDHLVAAAHGHHERTTPIGPKPIDRIVESLGADAAELHALGSALQGQRDPERMAKTKTAAWDAGFIDGFVVGVRAVRAASGDGDA